MFDTRAECNPREAVKPEVDSVTKEEEMLYCFIGKSLFFCNEIKAPVTVREYKCQRE